MTDNTPEAKIKIADFGFAKHLEEASMAHSLCGTPLYMVNRLGFLSETFVCSMLKCHIFLRLLKYMSDVNMMLRYQTVFVFRAQNNSLTCITCIQADLWSVGCVLFEMLVASPPFRGRNQSELFSNIREKALEIPSEVEVSRGMVEILQMVMTLNIFIIFNKL